MRYRKVSWGVVEHGEHCFEQIERQHECGMKPEEYDALNEAIDNFFTN
jgi:hypothetical protein